MTLPVSRPLAIAVALAALLLSGCTDGSAGDDAVGTTLAVSEAAVPSAEPRAEDEPATEELSIADELSAEEPSTDEPATEPAPTPARSAAPTKAATASRRPAAPPAARPASPVQPVPRYASPRAVAADIIRAERALRSRGTSARDFAAAAVRQQLAYRQLVMTPAWREPVFAALPQPLRHRARSDVSSGASLRRLGSPRPQLPNWRIIRPEPADRLLEHFRKGERATGIHWSYLAAINLVETKMGRIRGLSTAGARGPMQFMPGTWAEVGRGDIDDPHDSIQAAARYLVRRGGLRNIKVGLRGYNNSRHYVDAVHAYAAWMRQDPLAYRVYYEWQVTYPMTSGDVVLREGFDAKR